MLRMLIREMVRDALREQEVGASPVLPSIDVLETLKTSSAPVRSWLEDREIVFSGIDKIKQGLLNIRVGNWSKVISGLDAAEDAIDNDVLLQGPASDLSKAIKETGSAVRAMTLTPEGKTSHLLKAYIATLAADKDFTGGPPNQLKDYNIWLNLKDDDAAIRRFDDALMIQFGTGMTAQLAAIKQWVDAVDRLTAADMSGELKKTQTITQTTTTASSAAS
jgi:hypothetical protein